MRIDASDGETPPAKGGVEPVDLGSIIEGSCDGSRGGASNPLPKKCGR